MHEGLSDEELDVVTLMREITQSLDTTQLPSGNTVLQCTFVDLEESPVAGLLVGV